MTQYERQIAAIQNAIEMYHQQPKAYSDTEIRALMEAASQYGIRFEPQFNMGRAIKNFGFEALDTALLGLLPNDWGPEALTGGERAFGFAGDLLGLAVPGALAMKAGKGALGALRRGSMLKLPQKAGSYASARGYGSLTSTATGGKIAARLEKLRRAASATKNPKLKAFYQDAIRRSMTALGAADEVAATGGRALARTLSSYPRTVKYGVGIPTFLGLEGLLEGSDEEEVY